jgi:hypothetical protein
LKEVLLPNTRRAPIGNGDEENIRRQRSNDKFLNEGEIGCDWIPGKRKGDKQQERGKIGKITREVI